MSGRTSGSWPCSTRRVCHWKKSQSTSPPASTSQTVGDSPAQDGPSGRGWIQPHSPERRTPKTTSASPSAESTAPTKSSCGRSSTGASAIRRASRRIAMTRTTSPANTQRHEKYVVQKPPMSGPTATATAPAAATSPYAAGRRSRGKLPATSATIAGRIKRRSHALEERPAEQEHGEVGSDRGRERPAPVDHAPDRERALAPDDRADLGAGDHQRGHHERVRRDRALDPGDRGPDVLGHRRDRDVHDRAVERHEELPRREREQDEHRAARASGRFRSCCCHWAGDASGTAGPRTRFQTRSRTMERTVMATMAANVCGAFRSVSTAKKASTTAVAPIAASTTGE